MIKIGRFLDESDDQMNQEFLRYKKTTRIEWFFYLFLVSRKFHCICKIVFIFTYPTSFI
jgi:hypothetical protein